MLSLQARPVISARPTARTAARTATVASAAPKDATVAKVATAAAAVTALVAASPAVAATEVATLAGADARLGILLGLFVPGLAWVALNMAQPVLNQINSMSEANKATVGGGASKARKGRAAAIGLGLSAASLLAASSAQAANEVASLAADGRPVLFLALFAPALIWVGINIAGPAFNQIKGMADADKPAPPKGGKAKKPFGRK